MVQTDPIADFLTRLRNAQHARHSSVEIPMSKMKNHLAEILYKEGFVGGVEVVSGNPFDTLKINLKYRTNGEPMIHEIRRISRPGCRQYASAKELVSKRELVSTMIVTTSKGVMTDKEACEAGLGGELICRVA